MNAGIEPRHSAQPKQRPVWLPSLTGFALLILWLGMVYAGYRYIDLRLARDHAQMQEYIQRSIQEVRETNALNVQDLQQEIQNLEKEMQNVRQAMEKADQTISTSSSTTRQALDDKVKELDQRLKDLTQSLKILQEDKSATR